MIRTAVKTKLCAMNEKKNQQTNKPEKQNVPSLFGAAKIVHSVKWIVLMVAKSIETN